MQRTETSVLADLIETLEDGRQGFQKVAERLEKEDQTELASRMRRFGDERNRMSVELREFASAKGESIEETGSAAGSLHRSWISLKDALTGDDPHAVLAAAEEGEDHAVEEYEKALRRDGLSEDLRALISRQAGQVRSAHDEVRDLRDQTG